MPVDIKQFLPTFIEESMEMLQEAEDLLLNIDLNHINKENIHRMFRIMHSLKGNSAAFNFNTINQLTHTLETFLDQVRSDQQSLSQADIDLLLQAVDCLRSNVSNCEKPVPDNEEEANQLILTINQRIKEMPANHQPTVEENKQSAPITPSKQGWHILFRPEQALFKKGNEPLRLIHTLMTLGKLEVQVDYQQLPDLYSIDPKACYLSWEFKLYSEQSKSDLEEIFSWMTDLDNVKMTALILNEEKQKKLIRLSPPAATTQSVRVTTEKIDNLINMIGELVITQSIINQIVKDFNPSTLANLYQALGLLEQNSRELQASVMRIRMLPIHIVFNRFPRIVHDIAKQLDKKIELVVSGTQTELDKTMLEKLSDPLLHLIRNSIDHGIEPPDIRVSLGKAPTGIIQLDAYQEGSHIIIEVSDDGRGLDKEIILQKSRELNLIGENDLIPDDQIYELILNPGFTTSTKVSDISGRGVGLNIVKENIKQIGGDIEIFSSKDVGTKFRLSIPLTLAIMDCQVVKVSDQFYIIPLAAISEIMPVDLTLVNAVKSETLLYYFRDNYIPIIFLHNVFSIVTSQVDLQNKILIVVDVKNKYYALLVDELLAQQQVVIKNLEDNYGKINGISGVTLLGDGQIALIIDIKETVDLSLNPSRQTQPVSKALINKLKPEVINLKNRSNQSLQLLSFLLSDKEFAVNISEVKEIRMLEKMTTLPNSQSYIKGAINVRGNIIPIIDLHDLFEFKTSEYGKNTVIITLNIIIAKKTKCVGIIVQQVLDTYTVNEQQIMDPPVHQSIINMFIKGLITVDNHMVTLLNTKNLVELVNEQEMAL